ncbi:MAG: MmcQ/YjbR family DNA-binding protein [Candidatus Nomurabacteria bacterium]|jgi:predicted DNA-binding protein (MmcQ/YjbR family)|nr:MmcQ/YjbR family DNA-binding protein [Candidatus Nomurabacteria bacterium]
MKQVEAEAFIQQLGDVERDSESKPGLILFKDGAGAIFSIIRDGSNPLRVEAKCDVRLAKLLRDKYETVLPSKNMEAATWNEIICSGQLTDEEVEDLVRLSYNLVANRR